MHNSELSNSSKKNKSSKSPKFPGIRGGPAIRVVLTPNITLKRYNSPVLTNNNCAKFYEDAIVPNMPFKSLDIAPSVARITGVDKGGPGGQAPPNDRAKFFLVKIEGLSSHPCS